MLVLSLHLAVAEDLPVTEIGTLRRLSRVEADARKPMRLRGVVTYYEPAWFLSFIQDSTGGTYVGSRWSFLDPGDATKIRVGSLVEVEGVTTGGRFAPFLGANNGIVSVCLLGEAPLPAPLRPVRGELLDPKFHSQLIEVEAFARELRLDRKRLTITLVFGGRQFEAHVPGEWKAGSLPDFAGSDVRVSGVFGSIFNEHRQLIGMQLMVPSLEKIEVLDPKLERAFTQPARAAREIMQFNPGSAERMRLQGVVTFQLPGRGFYLRDPSGSVWVQSVAPDSLPTGTAVDAVGFGVIEQRAPVLRDAVLRIGEAGPAVEPVLLDAGFGLDVALHNELVRVEGLVVDRLVLPQSHTLAIQSGETYFNARFAGEGRVELPDRGSWVAVTGICQNIFRGEVGRDSKGEEAQEPVAFNVLMRSRADLAILRKPSWWTVERLIYLAVGLGVTVAGALGWAALLRRRVDRQSAIIADKVSRERIVEERTRIARELHDTLEQHLAGVAIQLEAAAARLPEEPGAADEALTLGAAMLRHSRTEARRSVWDLRSQLLEQNGLPQTLRELAESMSSEGCPIAVVIEGDERRFDPQAEFHLLRIVQEALANAVKHGKASRIEVRLELGPEATVLRVRDNGIGFDPRLNSGARGAHFGLLGMRERVAKLRGHLKIESRPNEGAQIAVTVPL